MMSKKFPSGVVTGDGVQAIFNDAQEHEYALPAVNVVGTNSVNAVLETAAEVNSPVMIQFSNGGGSFYAGKSLDNTEQKSAIAGSVSGAMHVHQLAKHMMYPLFCIPIMLRENFCLGLMECLMRGKVLEQKGKSLYSSHMLDLSEEPIDDNLSTVRNISEE